MCSNGEQQMVVRMFAWEKCLVFSHVDTSRVWLVMVGPCWSSRSSLFRFRSVIYDNRWPSTVEIVCPKTRRLRWYCSLATWLWGNRSFLLPHGDWNSSSSSGETEPVDAERRAARLQKQSNRCSNDKVCKQPLQQQTLLPKIVITIVAN